MIYLEIAGAIVITCHIFFTVLVSNDLNQAEHKIEDMSQDIDALVDEVHTQSILLNEWALFQASRMVHAEPREKTPGMP